MLSIPLVTREDVKQKQLSILESIVPNNLHPVILKNWLRSSLNINVDFEQILICGGKKKFQRTSKECYYFQKSEMSWYEELQAT